MKQLKIGNVQLQNSYILGPMAGVTDLPFRLLCKEQGAGLVCMEMVSAKGILYNNKNTESLPVPKVVRNGEGSALMKNPKLVFELVSAVVKAIEKPVTVKIRKGFDEQHVNAVEIAKIIEEAGAAAVAVHGRTREQYYSGKADWEIISKVKDAVSIPVIGNGDVTSGERAIAMREQTGCDGVMIARGAQGNPWIFSELTAYEQNGTLPPRPSVAEIKKTMLRHAALQLEYKGEYLGIREMRKHVAWYVKGLHGAARLRDAINKVETYEELENILTSL